MDRSPTLRSLGLVALVATAGHACVIPLSTMASPPSSNGSDAGPITGGVDGSEAAAPTGGWTNVTSNLAGINSECGNMSNVFTKPDEDLLIAGIALRGLWASRDGGNNWQPLSADAGGANIVNRPTSLVYDPQNSMRYWESGLYNGGGVYETMDDGATFVALGNATHSDLVSIDFSDPGRQTLLAGSHEQAQKLFRSTDGGMTWTNIGAGLPAKTNCTFPLVVSGQAYLVGCGGYGGGPSGVYSTTDGGGTWKQVTASGGADAPLRASDGAIYWASPGDRGMTRGSSDGQHWVDVTGPGVISSARPLELPDKRLATIGTGHVIVVSADQGASWRPVSSLLPYSDEGGVVYSSQRKAFYIWHFTCGFNGPVPVPSDAVMSFAFDWTKG